MKIAADYLAAGGNCHPSGADWDSTTGLLAYAAGRNLALWQPKNDDSSGTFALLSGHTDEIRAIRFLPRAAGEPVVIISGAVDKSIRVWRQHDDSAYGFDAVAVLERHASSVNCIAVEEEGEIFASGAADGTISIWRHKVDDHNGDVQHLQNIQTVPRFFPLAVAIQRLGKRGALLLAVGGTKNVIQVHVAEADQDFHLRATLTGHEGWIRSLDFARDGNNGRPDILMASASQDKYIRLWRVHQGETLPAPVSAARDPLTGAVENSLSNKAHRFEAGALKYSLTFEALLLGHEDWIYTVRWLRRHDKLHLLSASADNSLAIWNADEDSGIWVCIARLGEISQQKGSTTATGSTGGFWNGIWGPEGASVACLGRTGSWRLWSHDPAQDRWLPEVGVTGHVKEVRGLSWTKDGSYLLSTSADQTTRLHAEWKHGTKKSWHEFARPQIHGYDLNCIGTLENSQFVSGADEKLLRVFDEPRAVSHLLSKLCKVEEQRGTGEMPEAANIPVLGLSNKAVETADVEELAAVDGKGDHQEISQRTSHTLDLDHPPLEDHLARQTLWPEREKLYGHGYEIITLATSCDSSIIATACKASSIDHAVVRLYRVKDWHELKPPLSAHSLTVTCLRFSDDDQYLLSVGRDRQWTVFKRGGANKDTFRLHASYLNGHSRMILGSAWAPSTLGRVFATAGRDKVVKIWRARNEEEDEKKKDEGEEAFELRSTMALSSPVTTVDFYPKVTGRRVTLAVGLESGSIIIQTVDAQSMELLASHRIDSRLASSLSVTQVCWRPLAYVGTRISSDHAEEDERMQLAVGGQDRSVRIYSIALGLDAIYS